MDNHPVNLFSGTVSTLARSLDLRARKHEMILSNVANADTPHFKPFTMDVEKALHPTASTVAAPRLNLTDDQHVSAMAAPDDSLAEQAVVPDNPLQLRGDGNGVDIDREMAALAKNSLLYKASTQIIAAKFKGLKNVISGGNK